MNDGNLALRCNFATLGFGKEIIDRRAGRDLTTEEATELSKSVNERVKLESYPVDFEFKNTIGHRRGVLAKLCRPLALKDWTTWQLHVHLLVSGEEEQDTFLLRFQSSQRTSILLLIVRKVVLLSPYHMTDISLRNMALKIFEKMV